MERDIFWLIAHGDTDRGDQFWAGWDRERKEHRFTRDYKQGIRFCREEDAVNAGVGLTQGVRVIDKLWPLDEARSNVEVQPDPEPADAD